MPEAAGTTGSLPSETVQLAIAEAVVDDLPRTIADLSRLVRIPSVSWDGFDPTNVQASAEAVADLLRELEVFDTVRIVRAATPSGALGQPAVLARRAAQNGRPTVLLYAHHDVQPPGDAAAWNSPPFEPTLVGDRLYGRGTADDKAGVMTHVAAIRGLVEATGDPDLGIACFIEGEEEFGSASFGDLITTYRDDLAADAIVVADSGNWTVDTPAITVALRGNVTFALTVSTLAHASHSGMFGGAVPDAMLAATTLLATLWDESGAPAVVGLESREAGTPEYTEDTLRSETGLLPGVAPIGTGTILSRIWDRPSITITGIDAPSVMNASNTLIPSVTVKISVRVAPGQRATDAADAVRAHLQSHAPFGAVLEFADLQTGEPFLVDTAAPALATMKEALHAGFGVAPIEIGVGGSIPFISELVEVFPAAQILVTGVEDPDSRAHSPNESLHLGVLRRAIISEALLLAALDGRDRIDA
jgi:acetylornithine deacetylase/succinyl-diaminopimelate desuccinylase-like protein